MTDEGYRRGLLFYENSGDYKSHKELVALGYYYNSKGQLRSIASGKTHPVIK